MSLGLFALLLGVKGVQSVYQANDCKQRHDKMVAQGTYLPTDENRYREIQEGLFQNWYCGDKSKFPEKYINYFKISEAARHEYIFAVTQQQEIAEGLRPYVSIGYNKFEYNPFAVFDNVYLPKLKRYNETRHIS